MRTVFLSWSGNVSQSLADAFYEWLPTVLQGTEPFFSRREIRSGQRWFAEIGRQLENNDFGILFMTRDNLSEPWIHFESGAISKVVGDGRVCPLLFDIDYNMLSEPLKQFQGKIYSEENMRQLVLDVNACRAEDGISNEHLVRSFDRAWQELDSQIKVILASATAPIDIPEPGTNELLSELLDITRGIGRRLDALERTVALEYRQRRAIAVEPFIHRIANESLHDMNVEPSIVQTFLDNLLNSKAKDEDSASKDKVSDGNTLGDDEESSAGK